MPRGLLAAQWLRRRTSGAAVQRHFLLEGTKVPHALTPAKKKASTSKCQSSPCGEASGGRTVNEPQVGSAGRGPRPVCV